MTDSRLQATYLFMVVAWQSGSALVSISYSTLGPVSTWMGDHMWAGKPARHVTSHSDQLSPHPFGVGKSSTSLHWLGLRRDVFACVG